MLQDNNSLRVRIFPIIKNEWLCITPRFGVNRSTSPNGAATSPTENILFSLGASVCDNVKYILESKNKKVNNIKATIEGVWEEKPKRLKEARIKLDVDSPNATKEEVDRIAEIVVDEICPIANTLRKRPKIEMGGILVDSIS